MIGRIEHSAESLRRDQAAEWHVRLQSDQAAEADWLAFEAWLGEPGAREAYDALDRVWTEIDLDRDALLEAMQGPAVGGARAPLRRAGARPQPSRRMWLGLSSAAAAAAAVAVLALTLQSPRSAHWDTYAAPKGQTRTVTLADGSVMTLGSGSSVKVSLEGDRRRVVMDDAEAVFDVAKDASRPFLVQAGDNQVRVVGTRFDVLRRDGRLMVTVERGQVEVRHDSAASPASLRPGQQYLLRAGASQAIIRTVDPSEVMAWRDGRLVYRDAPLSEVVSDLNRYFDKPVRLSPEAAGLRFSGVLAVDGEAAIMRRLELLLPVRAAYEGDTVVLRRKPSA